jgi:hypothetical protein
MKDFDDDDLNWTVELTVTAKVGIFAFGQGAASRRIPEIREDIRNALPSDAVLEFGGATVRKGSP